MKTLLEAQSPEELPPELLDLLLDEAERALLLADARVDEPGRRSVSGQSPEDESAPLGVPELRLAVAELIDAHPGIQFELERINDRVRTLGANAALQELSNQPHLLDLARLSLEAFFRMYPDSDSYETDLDARGLEPDDVGRTPGETFSALVELRELLRGRMN